MSLFDLFRSGNSDSNDAPATGDVKLYMNDVSNSVTIPEAEAKGMTVREMISRFADELGTSTTRIGSVICLGRSVEMHSQVQLGHAYQACATTESKA